MEVGNCVACTSTIMDRVWSLLKDSRSQYEKYCGAVTNSLECSFRAASTRELTWNPLHRHIEMIAETLPIDRRSVQKIKYVQDFDRCVTKYYWPEGGTPSLLWNQRDPVPYMGVSDGGRLLPRCIFCWRNACHQSPISSHPSWRWPGKEAIDIAHIM